MKIIINVSEEKAILAGTNPNQIGSQTVEINPADLSQEQRAELVLSPNGDNPDPDRNPTTLYNVSKMYNVPKDFDAQDATQEEVIRILQERVNYRIKAAQEKHQKTIDKYTKALEEFLATTKENILDIEHRTAIYASGMTLLYCNYDDVYNETTLINPITFIDEDYRQDVFDQINASIPVQPENEYQAMANQIDAETISNHYQSLLAALPERERLIENHKAEQAEREAKKQADREAKEQAEEQDRLTWIKAHGSKRLQLMVQQGYEYRLTYELERGEKELPGYEYDKGGDRYTWRGRANPSLEALELEKAVIDNPPVTGTHDIEIVWVTEDETCKTMVKDCYGEYEAGSTFEPCEGLTLRVPFARYDFVKLIDNNE